MNVQNLIDAVESIAPLALAEPWDRVGLQIGSPDIPLEGPVFLAIDLTEQVLDEALAAHASAVIAYHPPIWEPLKRLTDATPKERVIARAARAGLAVYAPHTSLDNATGGMTDWLCEGVSGSTAPGKIAGDCRALSPRAITRTTQECKVVTFVPDAELDKLRQALATAGAGLIGNYSICSFAVRGDGTFFGQGDANPAVGKAGRLEHVEELRLEMVCSRASLPLVLATLRQFHPYEEPAVDVYDLVPQMNRAVGAGRRIVLDQPATVQEIAGRLGTFLAGPRGRPTVQFADAGRGGAVTRVGVVCGAGSSQASMAHAEGCEVFVTGEMKHHEVMEAINAGMAVVLAGHTATERGFLPRLAAGLRKILPGVVFKVSERDLDPLIQV